jgi:glycosyltransferase involved in cell wall biosynthesis
MRILHIDTGREMRGGQWQVLHLLRGSQAAGVECRLLARQGPLLEAAEKAGLDAAALKSPFQALREAAGFDLLHAHDAKAHTWTAATSRPLVVARRVAFPVGRGFLSSWKYRRAAAFIAISEAVRRELEAAGIPKSKIEVVYDGVLVPASVIPYDSRPLGCIAPATNDPMKGSDLAIASGVELQFSSHLTDDLARARILLYLSRREGLGSAALLASAYGTPVVASRIGGLEEAVEHEVSGLLTENDPRAVAAAVSRLQDDPAWAAKLGLQGRDRVQRMFTVDKMVKGTLAVYRKLLSA